MSETITLPAPVIQSVDEILDGLHAEIDFVTTEVAPVLKLIERAAEQLMERGLQFERVYYNAGLKSHHVTIACTAYSKADLQAALAALANCGVRREKNGRPFDSVDSMTRLFTLHHGEVIIYMHVYLRGDACRRVQVGLEPKYEIVCDG